MTRDRLPGLLDALKRAAQVECLVGIPAANATRDDGSAVNNAARGYIHEFGAPEAHIPARPFLIPGVREARERIANQIGIGMRELFAGRGIDAYRRRLEAAGMIARNSVVLRINSGIGPALADATLRARARRVASRTAERDELASRAAGNAPSMATVTPLVDTAEMRNSIAWVLIG